MAGGGCVRLQTEASTRPGPGGADPGNLSSSTALTVCPSSHNSHFVYTLGQIQIIRYYSPGLTGEDSRSEGDMS